MTLMVSRGLPSQHVEIISQETAKRKVVCQFMPIDKRGSKIVDELACVITAGKRLPEEFRDKYFRNLALRLRRYSLFGGSGVAIAITREYIENPKVRQITLDRIRSLPKTR